MCLCVWERMCVCMHVDVCECVCMYDCVCACVDVCETIYTYMCAYISVWNESDHTPWCMHRVRGVSNVNCTHFKKGSLSCFPQPTAGYTDAWVSGHCFIVVDFFEEQSLNTEKQSYSEFYQSKPQGYPPVLSFSQVTSTDVENSRLPKGCAFSCFLSSTQGSSD